MAVSRYVVRTYMVLRNNIFLLEELTGRRLARHPLASLRRACVRARGFWVALNPGGAYVDANKFCISFRRLISLPSDDVVSTYLAADGIVAKAGKSGGISTQLAGRGVTITVYHGTHGYTLDKKASIKWFLFGGGPSRYSSPQLQMNAGAELLAQRELDFIKAGSLD